MLSENMLPMPDTVTTVSDESAFKGTDLQHMASNEKDDCIFREETLRESEIASGVVEERRFFLRTSLTGIAALLFGTGALRAEGASRGHRNGGLIDAGAIDFEKFVEECSALANQAAGDPDLNEDAHLFRLSTVAARLQSKAVPRGKLFALGELDPPIELGPIHKAVPLTIIQWRMAPYSIFPAHNHNPADVLTLCLEGECRVRHFDIVGKTPEYSSKDTFLIRETQNLLLTSGRMSSLTRTRDNIHTFKAGKEGAMGIDINTRLPGNKPFSFLRFEDRPRDAEKHIFEASWIKL